MEESGFVFDPPSDEEIEHELDDQTEEDDEEEEEKQTLGHQKSQSPWDFATYSESVAEEHARRSTTSVDFKISKALQHRSTPLPNLEEEEEASDSEPDRQVSV